MTDRNDLFPDSDGYRKLSYTTRCGFIDWGHALPGGALSLLRKVQGTRSDAEFRNISITLQGRRAFVFRYSQEQGARLPGGLMLRRGPGGMWAVRSDVVGNTAIGVAMAIYQRASMMFEAFQGAFPDGLVSGDSSFSSEDLVSNMIGFHRAHTSRSVEDMRRICGETSVAESVRIYDTHLPGGIGSRKNRTFQPILYPTREGDGDTSFPEELTRIRPVTSSAYWVRVRNYIGFPVIHSAYPAWEIDANGDIIPSLQVRPAAEDWI